jgi:uncharacterized membrane protein YkoI
MNRRTQALLGLTAIAAAGLAVSPLVLAHAESRAPGYTSSIRVEGKHQKDERAEGARYADLAKIDLRQATVAAEARVPGKTLAAAIENEDGNLVYSVAIQPAEANAALQSIKIDAGNAAVLAVKARRGGEHHGEENEEDDD